MDGLDAGLEAGLRAEPLHDVPDPPLDRALREPGLARLTLVRDLERHGFALAGGDEGRHDGGMRAGGSRPGDGGAFVQR